MKANHSSKTVILFALSANLVVAVVKYIVAFITGSSAMFAEAVHSTADTFNQVFLLIGIRKGRKEPDSLHPFGFSGELYFWSFIVAIILFTLGSVYTIYQGIHKILHPHEIENFKYAFMVLIVAIIAEGIAFYRAFRKINRERGVVGVPTYLRMTKKSELIVVFMEDLAALAGLTVALVFLFVEYISGILIFDGLASIIIGLILAVVAYFLARETKSLLLGESAEPHIIENISKIFHEEESVNKLIHIKSLQLGPEDIMIAAKVEFNHRLNSVEISNLINGIEAEIRAKFPIIKKIFIEPDIYRSGT